MNLSFRRLDLSDTDPCLGILKENYPDSYEYWKEFLLKDLLELLGKPNSDFWVVLQDNIIVGFGAYLPLENHSDVYRIIWVNVPPSKQGLGIGKKLVLEMERVIKEGHLSGCRVVLETDKPKFYKKIGYATYCKNGDSHLMVKFL